MILTLVLQPLLPHHHSSWNNISFKIPPTYAIVSTQCNLMNLCFNKMPLFGHINITCVLADSCL